MTFEEWNKLCDGFEERLKVIKAQARSAENYLTDIRIKCADEVIASDLKNQRWISTSVDLPKPNEMDGRTCKYYLVQTEYGDMCVARWTGTEWFQIFAYEAIEEKIVAWMPLPEEYKGGEGE